MKKQMISFLLPLAMGCNAAYAENIPLLFCKIPAWTFEIKYTNTLSDTSDHQEKTFRTDEISDWQITPTTYTYSDYHRSDETAHYSIDRSTGIMTFRMEYRNSSYKMRPSKVEGQCVRADEYKPKF